MAEEIQTPNDGIQAKNPEDGKWLHCCEGYKTLIYTDEAARDAKLRELRHSAEVTHPESKP